MGSKNGHNRILLNKNAAGSIEFCEGCDVVELEVGAVSLRLHAQEMRLFSALVKEAELRLHDYRLECARHAVDAMKVGGLH